MSGGAATGPNLANFGTTSADIGQLWAGVDAVWAEFGRARILLKLGPGSGKLRPN